MFCGKCGEKSTQNAKFCQSCGIELSTIETTQIINPNAKLKSGYVEENGEKSLNKEK